MSVPGGVLSTIVFVVAATDRDGGAVTCDALTKPDVSPYAERVILLKRPLVVPFSDAPIVLDDLPTGVSPLLYLEAYAAQNAEGDQLGRACSVARGKLTEIRLRVRDAM